MLKEAVGRRVAAAVRAMKGRKTVQEIAREAGISASALHRVMAGESDPSSTALAGIAKACETTPYALLDFDREATARLETPSPDPRWVAAGADLYRLQPLQRRAVMTLVASLQGPTEGMDREPSTSPRAGTAGTSPATTGGTRRRTGGSKGTR